jgi:cytochrome c oxidase cbb3-type subunit IV
VKALGLQFFTDTHLTLVGLIIFFLVFALILVLQFKFYRKNLIQELELMPLQSEGEFHE